MWYRVFALTEVEPQPEALRAFLQTLDRDARVQFHADHQGWFAADIQVPGEETGIRLERFLSTEEGIRGELNTWAAWLESQESNPHVGRLMQHMISTKQIFTLQEDPTCGDEAAEVCTALCGFLARLTDGVYQADAQGFLDAEGLLLVPEEV
jgi:hypothetical protein